MWTEKFLPYLLVLISLSPFALAMAQVFINGSLRPGLISQSEIEKVAVDLIDQFDDPEKVAFMEEHAAWYRSDNFHQGKWRRVGTAIRAIRLTD